ncbi:UDP-2,4-diacetamido-2,4,6-trideoxy-beta-L-altropyranose hydrolase [Polaribacter sp.]|nr:UDP-2,4-diacetamido-2,4,6-trideoxy-beta-L-altropyranose hydrolase [Polaribacter sp.]
MKKKIYFRADGNTDIGYGHIIRCLALVDMLKDHFECIFATRFVNKYIIEEIEKSCSSYIKLKEVHNKHFDEFLSFINKEDIVVLDNYFFTTDYQKQIKSIKCKLICIDDMHDKHYVADLVINHGPGLTENQFSVEHYTKLCLGLNYALLRKPFLNVVHRKRTEVKKCLICIGGADKHNITSKIFNLLEGNINIDTVDIIIGSSFLFKTELENSIVFSKKEVNLYSGLSSNEMLDRMQSADFGIFPASSISLEAISVGLPFMVGYYVENQEELYNNLTKVYNVFGLDNLLDIDGLLIDDFDISHKFSTINSSMNLKKVFKKL